MPLEPDRFDYSPIIDRPVIRWPNDARVAFWVSPNVEHYEYTPPHRPTRPDVPHYSYRDYGNRIGFWRMVEVLDKHNIRCCGLAERGRPGALSGGQGRHGGAGLGLHVPRNLQHAGY